MDGPPGMFGMPRMMGPGMMGPGMMGPGMMMGQGMGGDFPPFQASPAIYDAKLYCNARPHLSLMIELKSASENGKVATATPGKRKGPCTLRTSYVVRYQTASIHRP